MLSLQADRRYMMETVWKTLLIQPLPSYFFLLLYIPGPVKRNGVQQPARQGLFGMTVPQMQVPAKVFQYGDLMRLHKFDKGSIGILGIGKRAGGFAHVKTMININRERETLLLTFFP